MKRKLSQEARGENVSHSKRSRSNRKNIHCGICGEIFGSLDEKIRHVETNHRSNLVRMSRINQAPQPSDKLGGIRRTSPEVITL